MRVDGLAANMTDQYDEGELPNEDPMNETDPFLELPPGVKVLIASDTLQPEEGENDDSQSSNTTGNINLLKEHPDVSERVVQTCLKRVDTTGGSMSETTTSVTKTESLRNESAQNQKTDYERRFTTPRYLKEIMATNQGGRMEDMVSRTRHRPSLPAIKSQFQEAYKKVRALVEGLSR